VTSKLPMGLCLLALLSPAAASAQTFPDEAPPAKFQFGPLGLSPRIALKNLGIDSNPLNQSRGAERDFTATLVPGVDSMLRVGRGLVAGKTSLEWNYFNESSTQRSFNFGQEGGIALDFYRLMPYVGGSYIRTRQRPNLEIDERVQQFTTSTNAGTAVRFGSRLRLDFEGRRTTYEFGEGTYGNEAIAATLDRRVDLGSLSARYALTPLTTLVVRSEVQRDRFDTSPVRNSDSLAVLPGFELKPSALISGKVAAGFRRFDPKNASVPDYLGLIARVDAKYVLRQTTQFSFKVERDVDYSIEVEQPYFVVTGASVSVMQILWDAWYASGRLGLSRLAYRNFMDSPAAALTDGVRKDTVDAVGFGIGRVLAQELRVGVEIDHVRRGSIVRSQNYEGFKVGGTISYGY
jgi:hypothetical protein